MKTTQKTLTKLQTLIMEEIEKIFEQNPESTSSEDFFRAGDDTEYANPRSKSRGRALQRDKEVEQQSIEAEFSSYEDKNEFFLQKIADIYDQLETLSRGM